MSGRDQPPAAPGRTYRRSLGTRVIGAGCVFVFVSAAASSWIAAGPTAATIIISLLALLSLANLVTAWADRFALDDDGIEYRNRLLALLGVPPRRLAWSDVMQARESVRPGLARAEAPPRAVFLIPRSGRRIVLDSLEDFDDLLRRVRLHCAPDRHSP